MVIYDLIGHGVTLAVVIYVGLQLRSQLRALKGTVEAQQATIDAQAELMKAQRTVLQDVERWQKIMQQVVDIAGDPAALQREQAFQARLEHEMHHRLQAMEAEVARAQSFWAVIAEDLGEKRQKLAEIKSALAGITRAHRDRLEEREGQLALETESPQDP
jgi:hypothetical protein